MTNLSTRAEAAAPEEARGLIEWRDGRPSIYCDKCNGPCFGHSRAYLAVSHAAYWLALKMPTWRILWKPFLWLMPRAGGIAFACSCPEKHKAVRIAAIARSVGK